MSRGTITSVLKQIDIDEVKARRSELEAHCFSTRELDEIRTRPVQTVAGRLAVKEAVIGLYSSLVDERLKINEVEITGQAGAAPTVAGIAGSAPKLEVKVSISHSRTTAYGLAVFQEQADG